MSLCLALPAANGSLPHPGKQVVPQCTGITLSAAYLAEVTPAEGPGFLLVITNNTNDPIKLAKPFPTSAHWYAQAASGRWLWRASSGSGGALANALAERGPLVAYPAPALPGQSQYLTVGPHDHLDVEQSMMANPILRFRPSCERCRNPEDDRYQAVLAYAYQPPAGAGELGVLSCGLRSGPVVMPPLPAAVKR